MELPPDEIPDGLSAEEYKKLGLKYSLMGKGTLAAEAMARSSQARAAEPNNKLSEQEAQYEAGMRFGASLLSAVMKAMQSGEDESSASESGGKEDPFEQMKSQLKALNVPDDVAEEQVKKIKESLKQMRDSETNIPPQDIPEGLTAHEYYNLGLRYKEAGWTEKARDALQFAIDADPEGETGLLAQRFLRTKIPRRPVPMVAERENIAGYNQMFAQDWRAARQTFEELIRTYPDFEWPYGNLGALLIERGEIQRAIKILDEAVTINPYYVNAWLHRARAFALLSDFDEAQACLDRAASADPDDKGVAGIRKIVGELRQDRPI
jgi:tetratricopeptide (TPR) repeat protein